MSRRRFPVLALVALACITAACDAPSTNRARVGAVPIDADVRTNEDHRFPPAALAALDAPPLYVALTFDDGTAGQFHAVRDIVARDGRGADTGFRATLFVNSGRIDRPGYLSWAQLHALRDEGHEIGGHTAGHLELTELADDAERFAQVCGDKRRLNREGFVVVSFAYPKNGFDDASAAVVEACGYKSARTASGLGCGGGACTANSLPPADPFRIAAHPSIRLSDSLADVQGWITGARASGGYLPLTFHRVADDCGTSTFCWPSQRLRALIDWLTEPAQRAYLRIVRADQVDDSLLHLDALLTNGGMARVHPNGTSTCFQRLSFVPHPGTTYERVPDDPGHPDHDPVHGAHETIRTTSLAAGQSHRLVVRRDHGECALFTTPHRSYTLSLAYRLTDGAVHDDVRFVVYGRDTASCAPSESCDWPELASWPVSPADEPLGDGWQRAAFTLSPADWPGAVAPADIENLSFGLSFAGIGTLSADDFTAREHL